MLLLIDNYDSFTYNLVHYLGELGAEAVVYRNDTLTVQDAIALAPDAIVISPGPCDPDRAGIALRSSVPPPGASRSWASASAIRQSRKRSAPPSRGPAKVMHGKLSPTSSIRRHRHGSSNLPSPFTATRYHSLTGRTRDHPSRASRSMRAPLTARSWACAV